MEIVLIPAGVLGLALLIVPRLRRGSTRVRPEARKQRAGAAASSRRRHR